MKKVIIVFLLFISNFVLCKDYIIHQISCDGLKHISLNTVLYTLSFKVGDVINDNVIADEIKKLFSTGYFEDISIFNNEGIVTIKVVEYPIINCVKIVGNKIIKLDMIQCILDAKKINSGELLNNYSIFIIQHELENIYYNLGKFNAIVKIVVIPLSRNRINLKIELSEGKTAKVSEINIFGNHVFSTQRLLMQFKLYDRSIWKNILSNRQYQKQKLLNDLESLQMFYLNHGYAKFHIDDVQVGLDIDKKNVCISIYFTEGEQFSFESLSVCGNVLNRISNIKKILKVHSGSLYKNSTIKEIEFRINDFLGKKGYFQPTVFIEHNFNDQDRTVKLYVYIDVGSYFYVREIHFVGNDFTKDSIIRRELQQKEQTRLNYIDFLKDQERLRRISYFKSVNINIKRIPENLNQVDLIYNFEERNTGNLNLSAGIGTESGLNLQLNVNQENVFGTGNSMSITGTKNFYQTYVDFAFLKSYCGIEGSNVSGRVFYNYMFFDKRKTESLRYNIKNYGVDVIYSYPIAQYHIGNIGINYTSNYLMHIVPQVSVWRYLHSINIYPEIIINDECLYSNFKFYINDCLSVLGWTFDNLNHAYFPTCGSRIKITNKLSFIGSKNQYCKVLFDSCYYSSLDKNSYWVLMSVMHAGLSKGMFKKESPFYDNFYVGGIETIRGFRLNSIGPKAAYYCTNFCSDNGAEYLIKNSQDPVGGNAVIFFKNELIVPIAYINNNQYSDSMRISVFVDAGTVWDTYWKNTNATRLAKILDYSICGHIRVSSGVSLRWISPVGPIMFSYSKLIKKFPGDIEEPFQFSIGKSW